MSLQYKEVNIKQEEKRHGPDACVQYYYAVPSIDVSIYPPIYKSSESIQMDASIDMAPQFSINKITIALCLTMYGGDKMPVQCLYTLSV